MIEDEIFTGMEFNNMFLFIINIIPFTYLAIDKTELLSLHSPNI